MGRGNYQVKFYGFTADDTEEFCRNLATLLKISPEAAWDVLMEAPIIIKRDLEKTAAQSLVESLSGIQALSLMEPMNGSYVQEEPTPKQPLAAPEQKADEARKRDQLGFRLWGGVIVVAVAALLGFSLFAYFGAYVELDRQKPVGAKTVGTEQSPGEVTGGSERPGESLFALQEKIDELQEQLSRLQTEAGTLDAELKRTAGLLSSDPMETREKQQVLHRLHMDIASLQSQIRGLKYKRDHMETMQ